MICSLDLLKKHLIVRFEIFLLKMHICQLFVSLITKSRYFIMSFSMQSNFLICSSDPKC
jgi:hypothetical protein